MIIKLSPIHIYNEIPKIYEARLKSCHKNRINEFLSARSLLLSVLKEKNIATSFDEMEELTHQRLKNFPEYTFSFSHTKDQVALVFGNTLKYPNLGIDIERLDRKLPESVTRYLDHQDDDMSASIEKWATKEAAFKYFSSKTNNENFWLKSICLKNNVASFENHTCHYALQKGTTYLLAVTSYEEVPSEVFHGLSL